MSVLTFDHLAVTAQDLAGASAHVEKALGVALAPGGKHALMGTHNRLLSLGAGAYLEAITLDPDAPPPNRTRWFGLDQVSGPPRLTNWVARCDNLNDVLTKLPFDLGAPIPMARGDLRWRMAVPDTVQTPFDGLFPALIEWDTPKHPVAHLPDQGCELVELVLGHPRADALQRALMPLMGDSRLRVIARRDPAMSAVIETPTGRKLLQ